MLGPVREGQVWVGTMHTVVGAVDEEDGQDHTVGGAVHNQDMLDVAVRSGLLKLPRCTTKAEL